MHGDDGRPRTIVYVDGFNLYYGSLKGTPYRWLDLAKLADMMMPDQEVVGVKYFTAIVDSPAGSVRQQIYIGALEASGRVSTHRGSSASSDESRLVRTGDRASVGNRHLQLVDESELSR